MGNGGLCCGTKSGKRKNKRENSTLASHPTDPTPRKTPDIDTFTDRDALPPQPQNPFPVSQPPLDAPWDTEKIVTLVSAAKIELSALVETSTSLPLRVNKPDMLIYGVDTHRGFLMKSVWEVPYSPRTVLDFELINELRLQWDPNVAELRLVGHVTEEITINYERYKKMMIVSQRDLLTAGRWEPFKSGFLDYTVSVEVRDEPPHPNMVRAHLFIGGFDIQPTATGTVISLYSEMDFGGAIPNSLLVSMSAMTLPGYIKAFRQGLDKYAKSLSPTA